MTRPTPLSALVFAALIGSASAQETCPQPGERLEGTAALRALSLDLRGVVPTPDEYAQVGEDGEIPDDLLETWLDSEAFAWQVVRHHRDLLWPNVSDIRLLSNRQRLKLEDGVWYRYLVAPNYRGGPVSCGDFEATWDSEGALVLTTASDGTIREGWTWVTPYWDPANPIKVCAFEAQEALTSPWGTRCDTYDGRYDPHCGCGPNLAWCDIPDLGHNGDVDNPPVHRAIAGDVEHRVARVIGEDLSYLELLTGSTAFVNGPLVHFYRYQLEVPAHVRFNEVPVDPDLLPDLAYTDEDTWLPVTLGPEQSGILTSPFFLMKYQTRRARANRFFNAFLCQPFQPPDGGLTGLDSPDISLDLTQRQGCQYCHALLEPAGAHWARWIEYGAGYLDPEGYSPYDPACAWCATSGGDCSAACSNHYLVDPISSEEDPYIGWLRSYEFLEERHQPNAEQGPALLVHQAVSDGRLQRCVARRTAEWLLGREMEPQEEPWIDDLAQGLVEADFRYDRLVKAIVTSDNYRRVR